MAARTAHLLLALTPQVLVHAVPMLLHHPLAEAHVAEIIQVRQGFLNGLEVERDPIGVADNAWFQLSAADHGGGIRDGGGSQKVW